jgi:hypothetical protein
MRGRERVRREQNLGMISVDGESMCYYIGNGNRGGGTSSTYSQDTDAVHIRCCCGR